MANRSRPNRRAVKLHRSYTVEEVSRELGVAKGVARQPSCPVPTTTLAGFEAAGVGVLFGVLSQLSPSFWLSLMVVAGISS
jgi:hypothetical protein